MNKIKKKIILCHGVFDILHIGHIKYLKKAKTLGDKLFVSITADKYVNKGPGRPVFNQFQRKEFLETLKFVNKVIISNDFSAVKIIKKIKPDFYVKGADYLQKKNDFTKKIIIEKKTVEKYGGKFVALDEEMYSSSNIINNSFSNLNNEQKSFLYKIKKKYSFEKLKNYLDQLEKKSFICLGELILDKYIFCNVVGKSGKDPHLVYEKIHSNTYIGGAGAIANQISEFTKNVNLISYIGAVNSKLNFIKKNISNNINFEFVEKKNSPTIIKERFIEKNSNTKVFGVYYFNNNFIDQKSEINIKKTLKRSMKLKKSSIIVSDYGHGLISKNLAKYLSSSNHLYLNTQINASNIGYHSLNNYNKINTLLINEKELRYEMRDKFSNIDDLSKKLISKTMIKNLIVTRGAKGLSMYYLEKKKILIIKCPAFANKIVDKIGAGDTILSLISIFLSSKMPRDLSIFLASLGAAMSVERYANSETISKDQILNYAKYILK